MHPFVPASDGEVGSGNRGVDGGVCIGRLPFAETKIELNIGLTDGARDMTIIPVATRARGTSFDGR